MGWNGLDLVNDFSAELGDISPAFKTKVLRWINEGVKDIATSHQWPFLREKGKVVLTSGLDTHPITLSKPSAPTVAALAGGSLALVEYKVLITFLEGFSGTESIAGEASTGVIPAGSNLSIELSDIPFSTNPLVTDRKVYLSKAGGAFAYYGSIGNNLEETPGTPDPLIDPPTPITFNVVTDTASQITPPEENAIHMIDGELFIEGTGIIFGTSVQDLMFRSNASSSSGTPAIWAPINQEEIQVYPKPSSDKTVSFFYFKLPAQVFGLATSVPQIPSWLREDLKNYVISRGFDFRDRAGKESKKINYENGLRVTISRKGQATKKSGRVRCTTGDSDGNGV